MVSFPNAKINLGLHVVEKRTDGFHNIETIFYPIKGLCDILEVIPSKTAEASLHNTGFTVDAPTASNLCIKAWQLLQNIYKIPPVDIYLHKQIPFGAGLGGGSADAAQTLLILNELFKLELSNDVLKQYALKLGSDCAFFIENKPMLASGRGEILSPINIDLSRYYIAVLKPSSGVSTAQAYAGITPRKSVFALADLSQYPIEQWKELLRNDFEPHIFNLLSEVAKLKEMLYKQGAAYASMSGSGSSVYGLFKSNPTIGELPKDCFVHISRL